MGALAEGEGRDNWAAVANSAVWAQVCEAVLEYGGVHNSHACHMRLHAECMHNAHTNPQPVGPLVPCCCVLICSHFHMVPFFKESWTLHGAN